MLLFGPKYSLIVNVLLYLPNMIWLIRAPCGPQFRPAGSSPPARPFKGFKDLTATWAEVMRHRAMWMMILMAAGASWFISNSYQAQMPAFAQDIGHTDPGFTFYSDMSLWDTYRTVAPLYAWLAPDSARHQVRSLIGFWRGLSLQHHLTPFLCALGWFVLGYAGLGISLIPLRIGVPPEFAILDVNGA